MCGLGLARDKKGFVERPFRAAVGLLTSPFHMGCKMIANHCSVVCIIKLVSTSCKKGRGVSPHVRQCGMVHTWLRHLSATLRHLSIHVWLDVNATPVPPPPPAPMCSVPPSYNPLSVYRV